MVGCIEFLFSKGLLFQTEYFVFKSKTILRKEKTAMKIIDLQTAKEFFNAPAGEKLQEWCSQNGFCGLFPEEENEHDFITAAALYYAKTKHPKAKYIDICSFASIVAYFTTGMYAGFGTEEYVKERIAENAAIAFAGGVAPVPGSIFGLIPEKPQVNSLDMLDFFEAFYFNDKCAAVAQIMNISRKETAINIMLAFADSKEKYTELVEVANNFLQREITYSDMCETALSTLKERLKK